MWKDLSFKQRAELISKWHKEHTLDYSKRIKEYDSSVSNKFDEGGDTNPMNYEYRGTVYDDNLKNEGITHVAELPEVIINGRDPNGYRSSYDPLALYRYGVEPALEGAGKAFDAALRPVDRAVYDVTLPLWALNTAITRNPDNTVQGIRDWTHGFLRDAPMVLSPTRMAGTIRTGFEYAPWNPDNPGIAGSDETGQAVNNTFDLLLGSLGGKAVSRARPRARAALYNNITPWSYKDVDLGSYHINKGMEIKDALKEFLTPGNIDTSYPKWRKRFDEHWALHPDEMEGGSMYDYDFVSRPAMVEFRDQAWAKAMDQPYNPRFSENSIYYNNGDNTYSYNLDAVDNIRKKYGSSEFSGEISEHRKGSQYGFEDNITTNGGGVGIQQTPEGLYRMTDVWDLAPLQHYLPIWMEKLPLSVQDVLKNTRDGQMLVNKVKDIDAVRLLGGDPFKLDFTWNPNDARFFED